MTKLVLSLILTLFCSILASSSVGESWFRNIRHGNENVAQLNFYVHNILSGPNQTLFQVANASITSTSPTVFGAVRVVDSVFTAEPDMNSEKLGRVQGLLTSADMETMATAVNVNFVFTTGMYNGSTVSVQGRNPVKEEAREWPVVGGTGIFRFTRGYTVQRNYSLDAETAVFNLTLYATYVDLDSVYI